MSRLAPLLAALALPACITSSGTTSPPPDPDVALASSDTADGAWDVAPTLHASEGVSGNAAAHGRRVYPIWVAGSASAPVPLDVVALAADDADVRVAVLGPLRDGERPVLAAGGYAQPRGDVEISTELVTTGEHLIVVGAFDLARASAFDLATYCDACDPTATDVLASPKSGALAGTGDRIVHATLGDAARATAATYELWHASERIATGASPDLAVPAGVLAGDDLRLVVRDARGEILEDGVTVRFAPDATALVRTDALVYASDGSLGARGIVGMFEGRARLSLRSEARHEVLAESGVMADRPGQVGNGLAAFDATFRPGAAPPAGELMSIGTFDGNGDYVRLGCVTYGGAAAACPGQAW